MIRLLSGFDMDWLVRDEGVGARDRMGKTYFFFAIGEDVVLSIIDVLRISSNFHFSVETEEEGVLGTP